VSGPLTQHLQNRQWIRPVSEAAGLKNVLAARQLLPEENSAGVRYVLPSGSITINEFGRSPSQKLYKKHAA